MLDDEGVQHVKMRECESPIELKDPEPVKRDIANLAAALGDKPREMAFLNAPTAGQITFNNPNEYYATHEEYLHAAAEALRYEYKAIIDAGLQPAARLPGSGDGRPLPVRQGRW